MEVPIQVNGKLRSAVSLPKGAAEEAVRAAVLADSKIKPLVDGKTIRRWVVVPDTLVNLVVS